MSADIAAVRREDRLLRRIRRVLRLPRLLQGLRVRLLRNADLICGCAHLKVALLQGLHGYNRYNRTAV